VKASRLSYFVQLVAASGYDRVWQNVSTRLIILDGSVTD